MIRQAFVMQVHPGAEAEYVRRHQPIWPELEKTLLDHGVSTYSIFLLPRTHQLFAYVEFRSEQEWNSIAQTQVCQRWWTSMMELMPCDAQHRPVATPLEEVFHIEASGSTL